MSEESRKEVAAHQRDEDLRAAMSTPAGRRLLFRIIDEVAGAHAASFSADALAMAFREGRRDVGLTLLREIQRVTPTEAVHLITDSFSARRDEQLLRDSERADAERKRDD